MNRRGSLHSERRSMYKAASDGDWLAAELILERNPSLACDELTSRGDRALHVAAATRHEEFVKKLIERMSPTDLGLHDGHGYTACSYAAISGVVGIADVIIRKDPNVATMRNKDNTTPLRKAASYGNRKMVSHLLKFAKGDDLTKEEWFDVLMVAIRCKTYDVALEILQKDRSIATMRNEEGTALHLLTRLDILDFVSSKLGRTFVEIYIGADVVLDYFPSWKKVRSDLRLLINELWGEIERLDEGSVFEIMKSPLILHDAAKVGNVELITMFTSSYPQLMWEVDSNGYTMFHIAVMYRQHNVVRLMHQIGGMIDLVATSQDVNGNNILHLAAILAPPRRMKIEFQSAFRMHREITKFKDVEEIVAPLCMDMKNKEGYTPRELFWMQHMSLLEKSETWMRKTADSCMLVSTIMLTVVFAAAFTSPGGYNSSSGIPVLADNSWFTFFIISEAVALFGSTLSIIMFWSIMTSSFEEDQFLFILPFQLKLGLTGLSASLVGATSAFMSACFLVLVARMAWLVKSVMLLFYILIFLAVYSQFRGLWSNLGLPENLFWNFSLTPLPRAL